MSEIAERRCEIPWPIPGVVNPSQIRGGITQVTPCARAGFTCPHQEVVAGNSWQSFRRLLVVVPEGTGHARPRDGSSSACISTFAHVPPGLTPAGVRHRLVSPDI